MTRLFVLKTSPKNYSRCYSIRKHLSHHYPTSARALCCCARTWTWQETESSWREIGPEADKADPGPSGTVCAHLRRRTMLLDLKMSSCRKRRFTVKVCKSLEVFKGKSLFLFGSAKQVPLAAKYHAGIITRLGFTFRRTLGCHMASRPIARCSSLAALFLLPALALLAERENVSQNHVRATSSCRAASHKGWEELCAPCTGSVHVNTPSWQRSWKLHAVTCQDFTDFTKKIVLY